jgi:hypothetical protein
VSAAVTRASGPHATDIGKRDEKRGFRFHAAQNAHQGRRGARRRRGFARVGSERGKFLFRIVAEKAKRARRIGLDQIPEIRRRFGDRAEHVSERRMPRDRRRERAARRIARNAREPMRAGGHALAPTDAAAPRSVA